MSKMRKKNDFLSGSEDESEISDVDPSELQKMLEVRKKNPFKIKLKFL